ncbi:MAG: SMC-Scp complex subunit ScpB, partial [Candidatus ainarchaeum sp.]|nr:SMC-Scp complex subunit ScpB [Candidatus ainarchaeum sp.]
MENLKEIIKATLFVAGEGIDIDFMAEKLDIKIKEIKQAIEELKLQYNENSGVQLIEYKNKIQLASNPNYAELIASVLNPIREKALTKSALETLAIIAYKQPITRHEIEDIRKVGCDYAINILEEHKMIEVVGRKDAVGKPLLYGTTEEFLKRFGLNDVDALPDYTSLLERIAVIRQDEKQTNDNLYNDFKLPDMETAEFSALELEVEELADK